MFYVYFVKKRGFFECVIMTSWVTLLLRHFVITSLSKINVITSFYSSAWNPRVFVETGGREKRLKPTGGENL